MERSLPESNYFNLMRGVVMVSSEEVARVLVMYMKAIDDLREIVKYETQQCPCCERDV